MWVDVTARPNGSLVTINGDGAHVFFSDGGFVACPAGHLRCAALNAVVAVCGQATVGDTILVVNDRGAAWSDGSIVHGVQACAIRQVGGDHFVVYWVTNGGFSLAMVELDADLHVLSGPMLMPASAGSQGLLDVNPTQYTDDERTITIPPGIRYTLWMDRGDWTIGQGQDVGGVIAFNRRTKTHWRVSMLETQLPPRIAVDAAGVALAAISYAPGVFVAESEFTPLDLTPPWTPPFVDEPPCPVPTFAQSNHAITIRIHSGNVAPFPFITLDQDSEQKIAGQVAFAIASELPLYQFKDTRDADYKPEEVRQFPGVVSIPLVKCTLDVPFSKSKGIRDRMRLHFPRVGSLIGLYRQMIGHGPRMNWKMADVLARAQEEWNDLSQYAESTDVTIFHQRRGGQEAPFTLDGIDSRDEFKEALRRMQVAAIPPVVQPVPIPAPTPVPTPPPPAPVPVPVPPSPPVPPPVQVPPTPKPPTPVPPVPAPIHVPPVEDEDPMPLQIRAISKHPILAGKPDAGFVPATIATHQDAGFIAIQLADGRFRNVGSDGKVEDNRDRAGADERFVAGVSAGTVVAERDGNVFVFAVA